VGGAILQLQLKIVGDVGDVLGGVLAFSEPVQLRLLVVEDKSFWKVALEGLNGTRDGFERADEVDVIENGHR